MADQVVVEMVFEMADPSDDSMVENSDDISVAKMDTLLADKLVDWRDISKADM